MGLAGDTFDAGFAVGGDDEKGTRGQGSELDEPEEGLGDGGQLSAVIRMTHGT